MFCPIDISLGLPHIRLNTKEMTWRRNEGPKRWSDFPKVKQQDGGKGKNINMNYIVTLLEEKAEMQLIFFPVL